MRADGGTGPREQAQISVTTGFDYSRGDYGGDSETRILYVPLSVKYRKGRFTAKLTVPHLTVTGRGRSDERSAGLGDITATASYELLRRDDAWPRIKLIGTVKLPTSDRALRFGTGETDYTASIDVSHTRGAFTPFLTVGYRIVGEPSERDLDHRRLVSAGFTYRFSPDLAGGLIYDFREASSRRASHSQEIVPYLSLRLSSELRLTPYLTLGLSDASPDLGLGMSLSYIYR